MPDVYSVHELSSDRTHDRRYFCQCTKPYRIDENSICLHESHQRTIVGQNKFDHIQAVAAIETVVDIQMNTNAVRLNERTAAQLLNSGLTRLLIGFDAYSKEVYETVRVGAKYETVIANVLDFLDMKKKLKAVFPVVRVSFVRTSVNEYEAGAWLDFWKERVDYLTIQEYITEAHDDSRDYLFPQHHKKDYLIDVDNFYCQQPFERVAVRGDGMVLPCCQYAPELSIGNVNHTVL